MKKFDLLSLSGVTVALVAVLLGQHLEGGSVMTLLNGPAILIVVGGSIGAKNRRVDTAAGTCLGLGKEGAVARRWLLRRIS